MGNYSAGVVFVVVRVFAVGVPVYLVKAVCTSVCQYMSVYVHSTTDHFRLDVSHAVCKTFFY